MAQTLSKGPWPFTAAVRSHEVSTGAAHPLGATPDPKGVNFSLFSHHATGVELLLFDDALAPQPYQTIALDPLINRSFHFWHVYVEGLRPGVHYAYRISGPNHPEQGHRFNRNKVIIDPYARGVTNQLWDRAKACDASDNVSSSLRGVVIDTSEYDWEGDQPLKRPMNETVIYEMHVGGFTRSKTSGVKHPGTFKGVIEKIPYLKELGITAVELLPVFEFDDADIVRYSPDGQELRNYWGYSTIGFFAPNNGYCVSPHLGAHVSEFRDMVKELHRAGIEVILDVVFNHTDEGNENGPVFNFRALDNSVYYMLSPEDQRYYMNFSGCGNTVNCNHPIVEKFIIECLEFWVREMHVDGFRFDEGSILSRGEDGGPMNHPPVLWGIELSEVLAETKIIAEAWDAGGLYQVGSFPGSRWGEWNGRYRDDVRRAVRGDRGLAGAIASRISGSSDMYQWSGKEPTNSINFITAHDGFTLYDLVAYNEKHNEANGEGNSDGANDNLSWNSGSEGASSDPSVEAFRHQQIKNFVTILMLSQGVPMFVSGDEVGRTQQGNNNAYCQDNDLAWFDWSLVNKNRSLFRFFSQMIQFRKQHAMLHRGHFFAGTVNPRGLRDVEWHGCSLGQPPWNNPEAGVLAYTLGGEGQSADLHVMINMEDQALAFDLPDVLGRSWFRAIDTSLKGLEDIVVRGNCPPVQGQTYTVNEHSVVVLTSQSLTS